MSQGHVEEEWCMCDDCMDKEQAVSNSALVPCYVALFKRTIQVGPEDWIVKTETKLCKPETTMNEIAEWACKLNKCDEEIPMLEISQAT